MSIYTHSLHTCIYIYILLLLFHQNYANLLPDQSASQYYFNDGNLCFSLQLSLLNKAKTTFYQKYMQTWSKWHGALLSTERDCTLSYTNVTSVQDKRSLWSYIRQMYFFWAKDIKDLSELVHLSGIYISVSGPVWVEDVCVYIRSGSYSSPPKCNTRVGRDCITSKNVIKCFACEHAIKHLHFILWDGICV